nr:MAG TPA: TMIE protein [Inoviridae sp.]
MGLPSYKFVERPVELVGGTSCLRYWQGTVLYRHFKSSLLSQAQRMCCCFRFSFPL